MTILTVQDFLRSIAKSLQISTSFPAALFVLVNAYFVFPRFIEFDLTGLQATTLIVSTTLIISYLLNALNYPLIRLLEGYILREWGPMIQLRSRQQDRYKQYLTKLDVMERRLAKISVRLPSNFDFEKKYEPAEIRQWVPYIQTAYQEWADTRYDYSSLRSDMEAEYPSNPKAILATPLGNVIAAFEEYPYTRDGMDSIALWPRLLPVLRKSHYLDFVVQEKSTFDFLLYMMAVTFLLGPELAYVQAYFGSFNWFCAIMMLSGLAVLVLYQALIVSAHQWGNTVRVAFDLHRSGLLTSLRLKPANSINEERQRWNEISSFITHRQTTYPAPFLRVAETEMANSKES